MRQKIHITTFRKGENQGQVISVATLEMEVNEKVMPLIKRDGCLSGEIIPNQTVKTVILMGREFVVDKGWGREFDTSKADFALSIPSGLAVELDENICPHCGKLISEKV